MTSPQLRMVGKSVSAAPGMSLPSQALSAIVLTGLLIAPPSATSSEAHFHIKVISSRPEFVSGDDGLVWIDRSTDVPWMAALNGADVTDEFRPVANTTALIGHLANLKAGENILEIRASGKLVVRMQMANHPTTGPLFSGPQQYPFVCQTEANGLGPALDASCSAKTMVKYYYKISEESDRWRSRAIGSTDGKRQEFSLRFKNYDPSAPPPPEVIAKTRTSDGKTVPYVVRRETGTINRAVYEIQFLHQPNTSLPSPWSNASSWNGRLVYHLGAACYAGYHQGVLGPSGRDQEPFVAQGYAVATSTLNMPAVTCNDRVSAETMSMVKEHFIESYGEPVYTIGEGASGGAMQAHLIAENYPGLLDGIIVKMSYPDVLTTAQSVADCRLLDHVFKTSSRQWNEEQKTAVSGFASWSTCTEGWRLEFINPRDCDPAIPQHFIYDADLNRQGARCDIFSNAINVFGQSPEPMIAQRPLDNVGVQYGLAAFNDGKITFDHFIELNARIGGFDRDGNIVATRTQASFEALHNAYSRGIVLTGGGGLSQIPIIDWRAYLDDLGDGHERFRSFQTRARLVAANGRADNQAMIVTPRLSYLYDHPKIAEQDRNLVRAMDQWLANIKSDRSNRTRANKISIHRPKDLADGCWATSGERIVEQANPNGFGRCNQLYPLHGDARTVAGGPASGDILKCALKAVSTSDYRTRLNAEQLEQLKATFPSGVCDYSAAGVGQQLVKSVWQRFNGPAT